MDIGNSQLLAINAENEFFNKHYNKELKLCEGKIILFY
jgi:hypothetical protein